MYFCSRVKLTGWWLIPLPGQGWTHGFFQPSASQGVPGQGGLCLELLPQGLPSCHHVLLQNTGEVCNQPNQPNCGWQWGLEKRRLRSKSIYYSLDCKNGQTNFPNLGGQTHFQPYSPKPEEMGGTRTKNTTGFSVNVGTFCTAKRLLSCTARYLPV